MPRLPAIALSRLTTTTSLPRTTIIQRCLTTQQQPGSQTVEGASGKDEKKAQPKILNESPPKDEDAPEDVKQHNRDMAERADRASAQVSQQDVEKDKVGKGFWGGGDKVGVTKDG